VCRLNLTAKYATQFRADPAIHRYAIGEILTPSKQNAALTGSRAALPESFPIQLSQLNARRSQHTGRQPLAASCGASLRRYDAQNDARFAQAPWRSSDAYSQYTTTYRPSHTTSTKCQYQAAPSKSKW
jgi:hypothetical protein